MIPGNNSILNQNFSVTELPTFTHRMDLDTKSVRGYTDEQEAMQQAIYKILSTERYAYLMYSYNYGIELRDLYGEPVSYVCPELQRRISEALLWDTRIQAVDNFEFESPRRGIVHVTFTAHTIYGALDIERTVNF